MRAAAFGGGGIALAALGAGAFALAVLLPGLGNATPAETLPSTNPTAIPRATCQPGDRPEGAAPLHLQGQVPWSDRSSGRAAQGYSCNLAVVANWGNKASDPTDPITGWANFDTYEECAYYSDNDDSNGSNTGTVVLDVSDASNPVRTEYLTTAAMKGPWEGLRVNARRGLLVADNNGSRALDIYDVSADCAHPRLLFSGNMPTAIGHEGWFSPDGNTWWMSRLGTVVPIDISDPAQPKELGNWPSSHGGWSSDDGTRQYFCQTGNPDKLVTLDSSDIQFRRPNPQPRAISTLAIPDNSACQQLYSVLYGTHPYVIQFGESAPGAPSGRCPHNPYTNYSHPRIIDIADETNPVVISEILNEVHLPSNCELSNGDVNESSNPGLAIVYALFRYGTHQCTPDRLHDPTILACAEFASGVRVYDIRDPYNVKELAYFNPATQAVGDTTMDFAAARPVVRATKGQIWFPASQHGFYVLEFENGVYPFPQSVECAPTFDYLFLQYNPEVACVETTAHLSPAPRNGWYTAPTVALSAQPGYESAVRRFEYRLDGGEWTTYEGPFRVSGDGEHQLVYRSVDLAGNVEQDETLSFKVDATKPVIEIDAPANGGTYEFASTVPARYRCTDTGSGVAKCRGPVASGDAADTRTPGVRRFTVTATDAAGNRSTATSRYTVVWPFRGFLAPIENPPVLNEVAAGAVVELSFDLGGAYGTGVVSDGFPQVAPMTCDSRKRSKAAPATGTTLAFASGTYTIRWQTDPAWAGKCRAFILKLRDTTVHSAEFRFN